jgi:hypothetical protein
LPQPAQVQAATGLSLPTMGGMSDATTYGRLAFIRAFGETADQIELAAIDEARQVFGDDVILTVVRDYSVSRSPERGPFATITVRVTERDPERISPAAVPVSVLEALAKEWEDSAAKLTESAARAAERGALPVSTDAMAAQASALERCAFHLRYAMARSGQESDTPGP